MTDNLTVIREAINNALACSPDIGKHRYREALTALSALEDELKAREWQDISTAPRDGTEVLLYGGDWIYHARWEGGRWFHAYANNDDPTHWKPLDKPPPCNNGEGV